MSEDKTVQEQAQALVDKEREALEKRANEICKACGGKRSEHTGSTRHMFTEEEGVLVTPAQARQAQMRAQSPQPQVIQLPGGSPGHPTMTDRLIQVMLQKNLINKDEALFILGVGPEPQRFRDPAAMMAPPRKASSKAMNFHRVGGEPADGDDSGTTDGE